jgi:endoglucanase
MLFVFRIILALAVLSAPTIAAPPALHRGVGLHQWLNWSPLEADGGYRWPPYLSVEEWQGGDRPVSDWPPGDPLMAIRGLGFDFVRLTVDPGPLLASDGARREEALGVLATAVRRLLAADLKVVFNLHAVTQIPQYGVDAINAPAASPESRHYVAMTADVARMLVPLGVDRVIFEPFNEPAHYPCDATGSEDWQTIMTDTVAAIRAVSTALSIVATGACGGSITGLTDLVPDFDDENLLYSFHMYEPHLFTHQRSDVEGDFASGLPWPSSMGTPEAAMAMLDTQMEVAGLDAAERTRNLEAVASYVADYFAEGWDEARMVARVGEAVSWAEAHGIPTSRLFMGEFGVIRMSPDGRMGAFDADRLRYLSALRTEAERHGIPWAVWEYSNPYGMTVIMPRGPAVPDTKMLDALGM